MNMLVRLRLYWKKFLKVGLRRQNNVVWSQITSACLHLSVTQSGQGAATWFPALGFNLEVKEQTQVRRRRSW